MHRAICTPTPSIAHTRLRNVLTEVYIAILLSVKSVKDSDQLELILSEIRSLREFTPGLKFPVHLGREQFIELCLPKRENGVSCLSAVVSPTLMAGKESFICLRAVDMVSISDGQATSGTEVYGSSHFLYGCARSGLPWRNCDDYPLLG